MILAHSLHLSPENREYPADKEHNYCFPNVPDISHACSVRQV